LPGQSPAAITVASLADLVRLMLRRLYNRTLALSEHPLALRWLAVVAFVESSFFPIPPDVMIVPMVIAQRTKAWLIAGVCTISSVLGGMAGYALGYYLFAEIGEPLLEFYGQMDRFHQFRDWFQNYSIWIIAAFGLTPLPYKVATITAGVAMVNFPSFVIASIVSRGIRFYLVAGLLWLFGPPIRTFIEKWLEWVVLGVTVLIVAGFVALTYL
jgi:membrane protein YqaA with SNARE-associated domain